MNPNRPTPSHIIIEMAKVKERILKAATEKQRVNYKGTPIRLSANFSIETLAGQKGMARYSQSPKREKSAT